MKTCITKTKMITLSIMAMFVLTFTLPTLANNNGDKDNKTTIEYVGELNQLPIYKLSLKNPDNVTYYLTITNSKNEVIHTDMLSGSNIIRNYQITGVTNGDYNVTFTIKNVKGEKISSFSVKGNKQLVNEIKEPINDMALNSK